MGKFHNRAKLQPKVPFWLPYWPVGAIVIGCAIITVTIIIWSLPRGLDILDESFYLLNYRYPQEYEASFTNFHLLVTRGLGLANCSIITYRWLALLSNVLGAMAFAWSFARWQRTVSPETNRPTIITLCYVVLGSLLVFSIFPRTLSYNSLNSLLLLLGAAAMLQTLSGSPRSIFWLLVVGIAAGLDVFVKPTTAFLTVVSEIVLVVFCWQGQATKAIGKALIILGLGIAIGLTFYFVKVQPPLVWYHHLIQEMSVLQTSGGHGMKELLSSYVNAASQTLQFMFYPMGPTLLLLIGLAWWWSRQHQLTSKTRLIAFALLILVGCYMSLQFIRRGWYTNAYLNSFQSLSLLLALIVLAVGVLLVLPSMPVRIFQLRSFTPLFPVCSWLFILPFLASAGTNNDLRLSLLIDMSPWFALMLQLTDLHFRKLPTWVVSSLLLLPAGWAAEQIVWGILKTPYGLTQPMSKQVMPLYTDGLKTTLLVDTATATFFNKLTYLLAQNGFRVGDPILAFYNAPGIVYVSGGISPGTPWYFSNRETQICHALSRTKLPIGKAYIITTGPLEQGVQECLRTKGIKFPQKYRIVGSLKNPYAVNLPSLPLPDSPMVSVYVPL